MKNRKEFLAELKKEFEAKNIDNLEPAMEKLNNVFQAASQEMYNAANAEGANPAGDAEAQGAGQDPLVRAPRGRTVHLCARRQPTRWRL